MSYNDSSSYIDDNSFLNINDIYEFNSGMLGFLIILIVFLILVFLLKNMVCKIRQIRFKTNFDYMQYIKLRYSIMSAKNKK